MKHMTDDDLREYIIANLSLVKQLNEESAKYIEELESRQNGE